MNVDLNISGRPREAARPPRAESHGPTLDDQAGGAGRLHQVRTPTLLRLNQQGAVVLRHAKLPLIALKIIIPALNIAAIANFFLFVAKFSVGASECEELHPAQPGEVAESLREHEEGGRGAHGEGGGEDQPCIIPRAAKVKPEY